MINMFITKQYCMACLKTARHNELHDNALIIYGFHLGLIPNPNTNPDPALTVALTIGHHTANTVPHDNWNLIIKPLDY